MSPLQIQEKVRRKRDDPMGSPVDEEFKPSSDESVDDDFMDEVRDVIDQAQRESEKGRQGGQ